MRIYLAGPIRDSDDPHGWRDELIERYDQYEFINPLDYEDATDDNGAAPAHVVDTDLELIRDEADIVLCRWEQGVETAGTPMELVYAYSIFAKSTVIWNPDQDYELSPWINAHASIVVNHPEAFFDLVTDVKTELIRHGY